MPALGVQAAEHAYFTWDIIKLWRSYKKFNV